MATPHRPTLPHETQPLLVVQKSHLPHSNHVCVAHGHVKTIKTLLLHPDANGPTT